jgi:uncharacterized protein (TIGR03437 family)
MDPLARPEFGWLRSANPILAEDVMKRFALCLLLSTLPSLAQAQVGFISTIAGTGTSGPNGDGGPATSASLGTPASIAFDSAGNLYVADSSNGRIRKISTSGVISTYAGGTLMNSPTAASAVLQNPVAIAIDPAGNLFIVESIGRVRKVTPAGAISTVAGNGNFGFSGDGGSATSASFAYPTAIALDSAGNLFIADTNNGRIRKITPAGVITTVAGSGNFECYGEGVSAASTALCYPAGVAVDSTGNLFIADAGSSRIRKVSPAGVMSTIAGTGKYGLGGDLGPATSALLNSPTALALDKQGNLFISDIGNSRIRKVSTAGIITTVAGRGNYGFDGDLGPATSASLRSPRGLAVDSAGSLFIADTDNGRIREVSDSIPAHAATLSVDPSALSCWLAVDGWRSQPLRIDGAAGLSWQAAATVSKGGAWLTLSPASGQAPGVLNVVIDARNLDPGSYQGTIDIRADGAIPPSLTINVTAQVTDDPPYAYRIASAALVSDNRLYHSVVAQGSLFVIEGSGLGPGNPPIPDFFDYLLTRASSFPLATTVSGTSVQIAANGQTYDAPVVYATYDQVVALLPSTVPPGEGTVTVTRKRPSPYPVPIHVVKSAFAIFTDTGGGAGPGRIRSSDDRPLTFASPAHPGDTLKLQGTGLGPVAGDEASAPQPAGTFSAEVFVGNRPAVVQYAGRSGCCAGVDEIIFQLPSGLQGCFVPVAVRTSGTVSNFASIPVAPAGQACSDPIGIPADVITKAQSSAASVGAISLGPTAVLETSGFSFVGALAGRLSRLLKTPVTEQELLTIIRASQSRRGRAFRTVMKKYAPILRARNLDPTSLLRIASELYSPGAAAIFEMGTIPSAIPSLFAGLLPPAGTCNAGFRSSYQPGRSDIQGEGGVADAGPQLLLTGPAGARTLERSPNGGYQAPLDSGSPEGGLPPGTYFVTSNGGTDIGAFSASLEIGNPLTWTNKNAIGFVDRSEPLTITWSGGPPTGYVVIGGDGRSSDTPKSSFVCVADIRDQTFTVPDFVLARIPHTSNGSLYITLHPLQNLFTAPGMDIGYFANLTGDTKAIAFQ